MGVQVSFCISHSDIGIPINFHEESGIITFWSIELCVLLEVSTDMRTLSRWGGHLGLSLDAPQGIRTSLFLVRWMMSLHSSHCREIRPSLESWHLSIHSTWGSKLRHPLTYLLLREGYCWGNCGMLPYFFNRILGTHCLLRWYGIHGAFLVFLCCTWCSSRFETGISGNLCSCLSKTSHLSCRMGNGGLH